MTIEQKLEMLRKAMEMGAYIQVNFHDGPEPLFDLTKAQAEEIMVEMSELSNSSYINDFRGVTQWFKLKEEKFEVIAFYTPVASDFLEEDVDLSGMEDAV